MIIKVENSLHKSRLETKYGWEDGKSVSFHNYSDLYFRIEDGRIKTWGSAKTFKINTKE